MDNDLTDLIIVEELCELLMIGRNTAYQILASGKIKCFCIIIASGKSLVPV